MAKGYYVELSHHCFKKKFGTLEGASNFAIELSKLYPFKVCVYKRICGGLIRVIAKYNRGERIE